jgi:hypothetical protein
MSHANLLDLTQQPFGRLTVLERVANGPSRNTRWLCQCTCGNRKVIQTNSLVHQGTKSCGCLRAEKTRDKNITHGMSGTGAHRSWRAMQARCGNPNTRSYLSYGGRGICIEWQSFDAFFADMGPRPSPKHSIERRDNDGNYSKENCFWALPVHQQNNKRDNHRLTYNDRTMTLTQWATESGLKRGTLSSRLQRGWTVHEALTRPLRS